MGNLEDRTVEEALENFYKAQKLDTNTIVESINYYPIGFLKIPFPNVTARQKILHIHDLNHVLMGFDTSLKGEAQLAALELGSGFPKPYRVGYMYSPFAVIPGLVLCPIKVIKAYFRGRKLKNACHIKMSKDQLFQTKVYDIRKILNLPKEIII